jgi:hypothetical protein
MAKFKDIRTKIAVDGEKEVKWKGEEAEEPTVAIEGRKEKEGITTKQEKRTKVIEIAITAKDRRDFLIKKILISNKGEK